MADCLRVRHDGAERGVMSNAAAPLRWGEAFRLGREGAAEGIAEYTYTQYIGVEGPVRGIVSYRHKYLIFLLGFAALWLVWRAHTKSYRVKARLL